GARRGYYLSSVRQLAARRPPTRKVGPSEPEGELGAQEPAMGIGTGDAVVLEAGLDPAEESERADQPIVEPAIDRGAGETSITQGLGLGCAGVDRRTGAQVEEWLGRRSRAMKAKRGGRGTG